MGVDYHPSFQQLAFLDQATGECIERRLEHRDGEAEKFCWELRQKEISVRAGLETTAYSRRFERPLAEQVSRSGSVMQRMASMPAAVFGPVLNPSCSVHRPFAIAGH